MSNFILNVSGLQNFEFQLALLIKPLSNFACTGQVLVFTTEFSMKEYCGQPDFTHMVGRLVGWLVGWSISCKHFDKRSKSVARRP